MLPAARGPLARADRRRQPAALAAGGPGCRAARAQHPRARALVGALASGEQGDATPFRGASIQQISEQLEACGYDSLGQETLYNGITGEKMPGSVFIGPTYYQRLKHMVHDKHHSRSRGPVQILTRQPVEGRAREGGLRFGEMERDCVISHGCANMLTERLVEQSDPFVATACSKCGLLAQPAANKTILRNRQPWCKNCSRSDTVMDVPMPYAFKLLNHELMAMNIAPRMELLTKEPNADKFEEPQDLNVLPKNYTDILDSSLFQ